MAKTQTKENERAEQEKVEVADAEKSKFVRVICAGALGTRLLQKGEVTNDAEYVALLETERGRTLVEEAQ